MDAMSLIGEIEKMTGKKFGITEADLEQIHLTPVYSDSKAEAL